MAVCTMWSTTSTLLLQEFSRRPALHMYGPVKCSVCFCAGLGVHVHAGFDGCGKAAYASCFGGREEAVEVVIPVGFCVVLRVQVQRSAPSRKRRWINCLDSFEVQTVALRALICSCRRSHCWCCCRRSHVRRTRRARCRGGRNCGGGGQGIRSTFEFPE